MHTIPFGKPMIGSEEKDAVLAVLDGPTLVHGPKTKEFEAAFAAYTKAHQAVRSHPVRLGCIWSILIWVSGRTTR